MQPSRRVQAPLARLRQVPRRLRPCLPVQRAAQAARALRPPPHPPMASPTTRRRTPRPRQPTRGAPATRPRQNPSSIEPHQANAADEARPTSASTPSTAARRASSDGLRSQRRGERQRVGAPGGERQRHCDRRSDQQKRREPPGSFNSRDSRHADRGTPPATAAAATTTAAGKHGVRNDAHLRCHEARRQARALGGRPPFGLERRGRSLDARRDATRMRARRVRTRFPAAAALRACRRIHSVHDRLPKVSLQQPPRAGHAGLHRAHGHVGHMAAISA